MLVDKTKAPIAKGVRIGVLTLSAVLAAVAASFALDDQKPANVPSPESVQAPLDQYPVVQGFDTGKMPWIYQPNGSPRIDEVDSFPSLEFPEGVTYGDALDSMYDSFVGEGSLPKNVVVRPPLPKGKVLQQRGPSGGIRISLTAPYGWDLETRNVLPASFSVVSGANGDTALADAFRKGKVRGDQLNSFDELPPACQISAPGNDTKQAAC